MTQPYVLCHFLHIQEAEIIRQEKYIQEKENMFKDQVKNLVNFENNNAKLPIILIVVFNFLQVNRTAQEIGVLETKLEKNTKTLDDAFEQVIKGFQLLPKNI